MKNWVGPINLNTVFAHLPNDLKQKTSLDNLEELETTRSKGFTRKRFYRLNTKNDQYIHLTCGKELRLTFENSQVFNKIFPEITTKPLFIVNGENFSIFGQEYFEGHPIDVANKKEIISVDGIARILQKIEEALRITEIPSSKKGFEEELDKFEILVLENESLFELDRQYLQLVVFPYIRQNLEGLSFSRRLSNGDLAAKNILVNKKGNFKIIDAEFLRDTHFHQEDWVRMSKFSCQDFAKNKVLRRLLKKIDPIYELILNLRQTILNKSVHLEKEYLNTTIHDLCNCLWNLEIYKDSKIREIPLLIQGIREKTHHTEKELEIKNGVVNLLQSQLKHEKNVANLLRSQLKQEEDVANLLRSQLKQEEDVANLLRSQLKHQKEDKIILQNSLELAKDIQLQTKQELESERNSRLHLEEESICLKDKILRMSRSTSWRITSPLRFLRRKFLDPFKEPLPKNHKSESKVRSYQNWVKQYDTITENKIISYKRIVEDLKEQPLFSIIMPVFNPPRDFFEDALRSVINQTYTNWELCIADDQSTEPYVREIIEKYSNNSPNFHFHFNDSRAHISETSNNALKLAKGEFVVLMDHDDLLRPHSLLRLAQCYNKDRNIKIIYSDEDKIDESGIRSCPYFKPDWNPDLLLAQNYFCHLFCAERALIEKVGGFRKGFEGSQDWDLALRLAENVDESEIHHIPEILYHWRIHSGSVAGNINNKSYAIQSAKSAVEDHLKRTKVTANVSVTQNQFLLIDRKNHFKPQNLASIIIPTKNNYKVLKNCIKSIQEKTPQSLFELILVDNQTTDAKSLEYYEELKRIRNFSVLRYQNDFNYSAINNYAAKQAKGDILIFLNDDTEIKTENWLEELISQASRQEIGAVGAKLLYPDGTIQHAGIILGYCTIAGEMMKGLHGDHPGQMQRANLIHNVSAVTGACLAVEKSKFQLAGGFDEVNLKIAFNDVDFCIKLYQMGFKNLFTPEVILYHHESKSRGKEDTPEKKKRFTKEINFMLNKWGELLQFDPAYNKNLSLNWQEQFEPAFPPR
jgi:GT2 family glycosyltransferase